MTVETGTASMLGDIERVSENQMVLNMGPQHPSTHGVMRLLIEVDGETVTKCIPDVGYLHRGVEKLIETHDYRGGITLTDRMDYTAGPSNNMGYLMAIEKLMGMEDEIPLRAKLLRTAVAELSRLASHHIWIGTHALDIGAMSAFLWSLREREKILYLFEQACGARLTTSFMRVGGTGPHDVPESWVENVDDFLDGYTLDELNSLLTGNEIFQSRTRGVGVIPAEQALSYGLTGPSLRGSGVDWDLRKARPYAAYDMIDFEIPVFPEGDVYARYLVRLNEMYQATRIVRQCMEHLRGLPPDAPSNADRPDLVPPDVGRVPFDMEAMINHFKLVMHGVQPPVGEAYFGIEGPKGELGYYFVSDGSGMPYRCHVRSPSFVNLGVMEDAAVGGLIADTVALIGSIDIVLGEVGPMSNELISLTVDGVEVQVPAGSTVLQACESIGVDIPTLCTDPRLDPYGACRMCVVEIQPGPPRPMASCTMQAAPGMQVITDSKSIKDIRKHVIELQLQHHPLDCPYCDQAGTCELQDETFAQEIHQSPYETVPKAHPEEVLNEVILINHNRCILCGRCVRICDEQIGVYALDFVHRAIGTFIAPAQHKEMDCERCGMCIETCPVGALLSRPFKHAARSWQTDKTASTCPHCSVGCSLLVESRHGDVVRTRTNGLEEPANGILCAKGFFGHSFVNSDDRLTQPLIRRNGRLEPATWREAISHVSGALRGVIDRNGPEAVGAVGSPNCTNEDNYALQRFTRDVVGSNNVYSQSSGFHETFHALASVLGSQAVLRSQRELLESDAILVVGADIGQTHNVIGAHIKRAVRRNGRQLLMATRLAGTLDRYAAASVRVRPGGEAALLAALAGRDDLPESVTGASDAALQTMRDALAAAGSVAVVWDTGVWTLGRTQELASAAASLTQAFADVRLFPLAERANTVGTLLTGMAPDTLPGLRPVADPGALAEIEAVTGASTPSGPGSPLTDFLAGDARALYVMGEDLVGSAGDPEAMREQLSNLDLLIVQDIFMSPTAAVADVVLPGASFAEKGGHFTNFEGRRGALAPAIIPVGDSRPDWEIIARLAAALGNDFGWRSHEPISDELERLWRMPDIEGGEPIADLNGALSQANGSEGFTLATEQHLYTAGVTGRHAPSLALMLPDAVAELNPADAEALGVADGDAISVASHAGALSLKSLVASRVPRGVVNLPDRFLDAPPRRLDPTGPNGTPVQVTKR